MQQLFTVAFQPKKIPLNIKNIVQSFDVIDSQIKSAAPEWPLTKIARIDLAILRLAIYELTVEKKQPPKVIIDESVELAKEFGNEKSPKFVNGVLGTTLKQIPIKFKFNL